MGDTPRNSRAGQTRISWAPNSADNPVIVTGGGHERTDFRVAPVRAAGTRAVPLASRHGLGAPLSGILWCETKPLWPLIGADRAAEANAAGRPGLFIYL